MSERYENPQYEAEPKTPEQILAENKASIRKKSLWAIALGATAVVVTVAAVLWVFGNPELMSEYDIRPKSVGSMLFGNIFFLLGVFFIAAGLWGIYEARRLSLKDIVPTPEAVEFIGEGAGITPYYSFILLASIVAVFIAQISADSETQGIAAQNAGLVKNLVREGEFWRLLTGTALHISALHIYFNGQALYGFGSSIEYLSNRAHLAIVFLLSALGGSITSFYMMPDANSFGASGGIMGLVGYLAIYGSRRRAQLPPGFFRSMLINIGFIAAFGLVAFQIIDNFAHFGGLTVGAIYGFLQIPRDLKINPREISATAEFFGIISMGIYVFTAVLSILLIFEYIKF